MGLCRGGGKLPPFNPLQLRLCHKLRLLRMDTKRDMRRSEQYGVACRGVKGRELLELSGWEGSLKIVRGGKDRRLNHGKVNQCSSEG